MELSDKNGHASIEEILASVRRIIAEEPVGASPLIDLQMPAAARTHPKGDGLLDDPSDFDLPSMFRTQPAPPSEKPAPLFGRLSEAIRAASSGPVHAGERADHALSTLKLHRNETAETNGAPAFLLSAFHDATGSRGDDAAASPEHYVGAPAPMETSAVSTTMAAPADDVFTPAAASDPASAAPSPAAAAPQVPRQMAAFKDTRFRGMGSTPAAVEPLSPVVSPFEAAATEVLVAAAGRRPAMEDPSPATQSQPFAQPPGDTSASAESPSGLAAAIAASYPALSIEPASPGPSPHVPPPVPVPSAHSAQAPSAGLAAAAPIEDSTADLLRPMLRQWLAENMPRMVEKALHIEVAESVKSTKK